MNIERFAAGVGASQRQELLKEIGGAIGFEKNVPQRLPVFGLIS